MTGMLPSSTLGWLARRFVWTRLLAGALCCALLVSAGCGGGGDRTMPPAEGVRPLFELAEDPMPFGAIPWPDSLYLSDDNRIAVSQLPGEADAEDGSLHAALRRSLGELDGFGALSPAFFRFDGALDPETLPASASESTRQDASVFLMDVDSASPTAFTRVPVEVQWDPDARVLAMRPALGHPLAGGRRYAFVVTSDVRDTDGEPLLPAEDFAAIRDAETRPGDPLAAEAHEHYAPVLSALVSDGVPRDEVVALAAFRVQSIGRDLEDARALIEERDRPRARLVTAVAAGEALDTKLGMPVENVPGIDVEGGVQHDAVGWMIHGRFAAPSLLSPVEGVHGRFERDGEGALIVEREASVPFTLWVPRSGDTGALRVALYQHGLGAERSQAMAIVDSLADSGWAVLAIDAPFHGLRLPAEPVDTINAFTGAPGPDGFGDVVGDEALRAFVGVDDDRGELAPMHPHYLRDALRQTTVDLMAALRLLRDGDWSEVREADPELEGLAFASGPVPFVGHSLGAIVGPMLGALEPTLGASVLTAPGGDLTRMLGHGAELNDALLPSLLERLGKTPAGVDWETRPPRYMPLMAVWQTLVDRGDPMAWAEAVRRRGGDMLLVMARDDETIANASTEGLAKALRVPVVGAEPRHAGLMVVEPPVRGNVMVDGRTTTRGLTVFEPATHALFVRRRDQRRWERPLEPPFEPAEPQVVDNPVDAVVGQALHFLESWRTGAAAEVAEGL